MAAFLASVMLASLTAYSPSPPNIGGAVVQSLRQHTGSSSLSRDGTWASCIGSSQPQPLHHQEGPSTYIYCNSILHSC